MQIGVTHLCKLSLPLCKHSPPLLLSSSVFVPLFLHRVFQSSFLSPQHSPPTLLFTSPFSPFSVSSSHALIPSMSVVLSAYRSFTLFLPSLLLSFLFMSCFSSSLICMHFFLPVLYRIFITTLWVPPVGKLEFTSVVSPAALFIRQWKVLQLQKQHKRVYWCGGSRFQKYVAGKLCGRWVP